MTTDFPGRRDGTPTGSSSSLPQKRALDDDNHAPAVSSPLNPDFRPPPRKDHILSTQSKSREGSAPVASGAGSAAMPASKSGPGRGRPRKDAQRPAKGALGVHGLAPEPSSSSPQGPAPEAREKEVPAAEATPQRYKIPPPKPADFEPPREPQLNFHHELEGPEGNNIEFFETAEQLRNKKGFHYMHCVADPRFPASRYYRQSETEPHGPHLSFEDMASHLLVDQSGCHVTTEKGFRMARANVAAREGRWYYECKITRGVLRQKDPTGKGGGGDGAPDPGNADKESHGHVRMGWARREASLDAPVGFDAYSYGIRDVAGQKVHMSRPRDFYPPPPGARANATTTAGGKNLPQGMDICEGDVIGLEIQLPPLHLHRKVAEGSFNPAVDHVDEEVPPTAEAANIVRDRIPIRFKAHVYFEKIDYHTSKELEDLMNPAPAPAAVAAAQREGRHAAGSDPSTGATPTTKASGGGTPSSAKHAASSTGGAGAGAGGAQRAEPTQSAMAKAAARAHRAALAEAPNPNHPLPALRTLPGSHVRVYHNGEPAGTAFTDLFAFLPPASRPQLQVGAREGLDDGMLGYYPAVSVFRGGAAQLNFGPDWWFPPPGEVNGVRKGEPQARTPEDDEVDLVQDAEVDGDGDRAMGGGVDASGAASAAAAMGESTPTTPIAGSIHVKAGRAATPPAAEEAPAATLPPHLAPLRPLSERFDEQVVEDVVWDVVDEVDFLLQDERKAAEVAAAPMGPTTTTTMTGTAGRGPAPVAASSALIGRPGSFDFTVRTSAPVPATAAAAFGGGPAGGGKRVDASIAGASALITTGTATPPTAAGAMRELVQDD